MEPRSETHEGCIGFCQSLENDLNWQVEHNGTAHPQTVQTTKNSLQMVKVLEMLAHRLGQLVITHERLAIAYERIADGLEPKKETA